MQPNHSKRRFTRLPVSFPIQIETEHGLISASLLDLSRGGVRLKVPGAALGVYRLAPMALVGRKVGEILGAEFGAQLNPERLGGLLTRRMRPVRIGQRSPHSADVELGCVLVPPLTDIEAGMLGLALPVLEADGREGLERIQAEAPVVRTPPGGVAPAASPSALDGARHGLQVKVPQPPSSIAKPGGQGHPARPEETQPPVPALRGLTASAPPAPAPSRAPTAGSSRGIPERNVWRAYVHPSGPQAAEPFVASAAAVSAKGIEVRVLSYQGAAVDGSAGVAATATRLGNVLGSDVALRLVDGATHLWTGPARIEMVEVGPTPPYPVNMWLAFSRQLRPAELRTLGLE